MNFIFMKNKILIFLSLLTFVLIIFFVLNHVFNYGKQETIIEKQEQQIDDQNQQIEKKDEVIETKNFQQKIINKTSINLDVVARREWMQLVFEERATENN